MAAHKLVYHSILLLSSLLLLLSEDDIDLVIPRGSNQLVKFVKDNSRIPVLGHADGVCHIFVDRGCPVPLAERILLDAKTDYPSACNAAETVLIHADLLIDGAADKLMRSLRKRGVVLLGYYAPVN